MATASSYPVTMPDVVVRLVHDRAVLAHRLVVVVRILREVRIREEVDGVEGEIAHKLLRLDARTGISDYFGSHSTRAPFSAQRTGAETGGHVGEDLAGKVAIVTGGASGIGRATAELFVDEGARVVIADVNAELGEEVAAALGDAAAFQRDRRRDADEMQELVDFAVAQFGGLHVMFNNAGHRRARSPRLLDNDFADYDRVMAVNLFGVMVGSQRAARHMAEHGGGSIINTASIAAITGGAGPIVYRAAKAAVMHFSRGRSRSTSPTTASV